jgi:putative endonuclease
MSKETISRSGNEVVEFYLKSNEVEILERDWSCEAGTVGFIIKEGDELALAEVKARELKRAEAPFPDEDTSAAHRESLEKIAMHYLMSNGSDLPSIRVRFDIVSLSIHADGKAFLRWHRDALARDCLAGCTGPGCQSFATAIAPTIQLPNNQELRVLRLGSEAFPYASKQQKIWLLQ